VPCADGNRNRLAEHMDELLNLLRGRSVGAIHVSGHAHKDQGDLALADERLQAREKVVERRRREELERMREHAQFVADRRADADGAMVKGEDAHGWMVQAAALTRASYAQ